MLSTTHHIQKRDLFKGCYTKVSVYKNPFYTKTKKESYKIILPELFGILFGITVCYAFIYHTVSWYIIAVWFLNYIYTLILQNCHSNTPNYIYPYPKDERTFKNSVNKIFYKISNVTSYNFGSLLSIPCCFMMDLYQSIFPDASFVKPGDAPGMMRVVR